MGRKPRGFRDHLAHNCHQWPIYPSSRIEIGLCKLRLERVVKMQLASPTLLAQCVSQCSRSLTNNVQNWFNHHNLDIGSSIS